jgi:hypothetical protein
VAWELVSASVNGRIAIREGEAAARASSVKKNPAIPRGSREKNWWARQDSNL